MLVGIPANLCMFAFTMGLICNHPSSTGVNDLPAVRHIRDAAMIAGKLP